MMNLYDDAEVAMMLFRFGCGRWIYSPSFSCCVWVSCGPSSPLQPHSHFHLS